MAKNFLAGPQLKSQGSRNGFDVSYQNQFTAPFGMILPCFFQRVNPDDKVKISLESQTICDGLVKPAFMRLKEHWDYYFIPTTQLWMPFDNFITGQNSYFSSSVKGINEGAVPDQVPTFEGQALQLYLNEWSYSKKDERGYSFTEGAVRLLDLLNYFNFSTTWAHYAGTESPLKLDVGKYNLFPLLCYQKVYYDYFRNPKYEDNDTEAYNIDDLQNGEVISDLGVVGERFAKFFAIHYRWQKKDYFTQVQPNVLVSNRDIGYQNMDDLIQIDNLFNLPGFGGQNSLEYGFPIIQNNVNTTNKGVAIGVARGSSSTQGGTNRVTVTSIRFAFAYDRLLRRMRQAGADFDEQMLAQFGVKPFDPRHGKCYYLGGYTNNLSSKDVTNVTGESIGDLAGQINSYSDNTGRWLKYHAKEHGYIIGVYSTSVDSMYQSYRTSRECMLYSRFDWFNPAFENLGLQPIFRNEYDYTNSNASEDPVERAQNFQASSRANILGYVPRYSELKTHPDECHGLLCNYSNVTGMREWNVQVNQVKYLPNIGLDKNQMQLDPSMFDPVSGIEYDGTQYRDHFVINCYTHSKKVSTMTMYEEF